MKLGIETESYHLFFQQGRMNVFDFIERAWQLGLDGVELNIIPDEGLHPEFGVLEGNDPEYLARVKAAIEARNLYCEIDTRLSDPEELTKAIDIAVAIGADVIRTYIFKGSFDPALLDKAVTDIKQIVPLLKKHRIRLAVENHEDETSDEVIQVVREINSVWVGAHCDVGNSMMAWEDPVEAVTKLAPYTYCTHFKDHIITLHEGQPVVCGVPLGDGNIDLDACFKALVEHAPITRINMENCFPYATDFARPKGTGGVTEFTGAFEIKEPPFDYDKIKPLEYYYPRKISDELLEEMMAAQDACVKKSVAYFKALRNKYCR